MIRKCLGALAASVLISAPALADVSCAPVSVVELGINSASQVFMNAGAGTHMICVVGSDQYGVSGAACSAMYATLVSGRAQGKTFSLIYSHSNPNNTNMGNDCTVASLGNWVIRPIMWVGINQ